MTNVAVQTTHPADETLAAFIDGRLDSEARQPVIEHMAECAECRDVLNTADELAIDEGRLAPVVPFWKAWVVPAASVAAAAAIGFILYTGPVGDRFLATRRLAALEAATAKLSERAIPGRPSIDMAYKDHPTKRGSGGDTAGTAIPDLPLLEVAARIPVKEHPTPANLHQLGVAYLLMTDDGYRKEAIPVLELAVVKETGVDNVTRAVAVSTNADLLNDLAAAYHAMGRERQALAAITRAWQLKKSPAIAFNRATILDTKAAWEEYLKIEPTGAWAEEARTEHLAYIEGN